nr:MAG TPA_asm: hypothetical protein [Caudoviricetes sp.]
MATKGLNLIPTLTSYLNGRTCGALQSAPDCLWTGTPTRKSRSP